MANNKLTTKAFIFRASKVHNKRYDYSKSVYRGCKEKIIIGCKIHGKFFQRPFQHLSGNGCPKCGSQATGKALSSTTEEFVKKAKKIHGKRYDYSKSIYTGVHKKLVIICPVHEEFLQTPNNHLNGNGCQYCVKNYKLTADAFTAKASKIHNNRYDYSKVVFVNTRTPIEIVCPFHGSFFKTPNAHLSGNGCRQCWRERITSERRSDTAEFIQKSVAVHGNEYDYSKAKYETNRKKVEIICKKHGSFFQVPITHMRGHRCPSCSSSIGEVKILKFLNDNNIGYIKEKKFDDCRNPKTNWLLKFDFYLPSKNLLIEYDGEPHFKKTCVVGRHFMTDDDLRGIKERDRIKTNYAKRRGIRLLRIAYTDFSRIDDILTSHLTNRYCVLCCEYD